MSYQVYWQCIRWCLWRTSATWWSCVSEWKAHQTWITDVIRAGLTLLHQKQKYNLATYEFPKNSWNFILPIVVSASKLGNTSPNRIPGMTVFRYALFSSAHATMKWKAYIPGSQGRARVGGQFWLDETPSPPWGQSLNSHFNICTSKVL